MSSFAPAQPPGSPTRPLPRPLGSGRDLRHRLVAHHVPLAAASTAGLVLLTGLWPTRGGFSVAGLITPTGYVGIVLLAVTLLLGPANMVLGRRNPTNTYLRRDVGTWTAVWSIVHVVVGFQGHGRGGTFGFVGYFVAGGWPLIDSFGLGNWTGLAATVLVVLLLVISTDRNLRELQAPLWKDLQRLNYTLFAFVVLHAVFYGALRQVTSPYTLLLLSTVAAVLAGQGTGIWLWRRRRRRAASGASKPTAAAPHDIDIRPPPPIASTGDRHD